MRNYVELSQISKLIEQFNMPRLQQEKYFHNTRFGGEEDSRTWLDKYYSSS